MDQLKLFLGMFLLNVLTYSCSTIERASNHEFSDGYYILKENNEKKRVYVEINSDSITLFSTRNDSVIASPICFISFDEYNDFENQLVLKKSSIDVDLTSILFKYRINSGDLPSEFTNDFNLALFAGPRFDNYHIVTKANTVGKSKTTVNSRASDFGLLLGVGSATIGPFSSKNIVVNEYNGMYLQTGVGAFLETNKASFGIALGTDFLLTPDARYWIYQNKPWLGFVVGIAL